MVDICFRRYYDRYLFIIEGVFKPETRYNNSVDFLIKLLVDTLDEEASSDRGKFIRREVGNGYICIEYLPFSFAEERLEGITDTVISGFSLLADEYPCNVKFS